MGFPKPKPQGNRAETQKPARIWLGAHKLGARGRTGARGRNKENLGLGDPPLLRFFVGGGSLDLGINPPSSTSFRISGLGRPQSQIWRPESLGP